MKEHDLTKRIILSCFLILFLLNNYQVTLTDKVFFSSSVYKIAHYNLELMLSLENTH